MSHRETTISPAELGWIERHLLNDFQHGLPLEPRPFQAMAERLGVSEQEVIDLLRRLQDQGFISRVGAVFRPATIGASTLAAMAVPEERIEEVAKLVNSYPEVNHNYQRDHRFNLWFVATAASEERLRRVLTEIERSAGLPVLYLPMLEDFHIDLGFDLQWT